VPIETIHFTSSRLLSQLYANDTRNLIEAERMLDVVLASRDDWVSVEGSVAGIAQVQDLFRFLDIAHQQGIRIRTSDFHYTLRCIAEGKSNELREVYSNPLVIKLKRLSIIPKTLNQKRYLQCIDQNTNRPRGHR